MLKKKSIYTKYFCLLSSQEFLFPGLPNLGSQIRFAQNRYTTDQIDLKYPTAHNRVRTRQEK